MVPLKAEPQPSLLITFQDETTCMYRFLDYETLKVWHEHLSRFIQARESSNAQPLDINPKTEQETCLGSIQRLDESRTSPNDALSVHAEDGRSCPSATHIPMDIVCIVSTSFAPGAEELAYLQTTVGNMVEMCTEVDRVALISYGHVKPSDQKTLHFQAPSALSRAAINLRLSNTDDLHSPAAEVVLTEALLSTLKLFSDSGRPATNSHVMLLCDGDAVINYNIAAPFRSSQIPIHVFSREGNRGAEIMALLSELTYGSYHVIRQLWDFDTTYSQHFASLKSITHRDVILDLKLKTSQVHTDENPSAAIVSIQGVTDRSIGPDKQTSRAFIPYLCHLSAHQALVTVKVPGKCLQTSLQVQLSFASWTRPGYLKRTRMVQIHLDPSLTMDGDGLRMTDRRLQLFVAERLTHFLRVSLLPETAAACETALAPTRSLLESLAREDGEARAGADRVSRLRALLAEISTLARRGQSHDRLTVARQLAIQACQALRDCRWR